MPSTGNVTISIENVTSDLTEVNLENSAIGTQLSCYNILLLSTKINRNIDVVQLYKIEIFSLSPKFLLFRR